MVEFVSEGRCSLWYIYHTRPNTILVLRFCCGLIDDDARYDRGAPTIVFCTEVPHFGSLRKALLTHVLGHFLHSRIPPVENGPFRLDYFSTGFFWSFFLSPVDSILHFLCSFQRRLVLLYGARTFVGSSVLRAFLASNTCFTRDEPSSKRVGGVGLSQKPPNLRSWRCTQQRAAKATAGVAVVGKMASITRATAVVWYMPLASEARSAPRWLAAKSNSSDSQGSVGAVAWYCCVVPGMGVWACGCVLWLDERCDGFKNRHKTYSTGFFDWQIQSKNLSFSTGSPSQKTQSKKVESKRPFLDCVWKPDLSFSRKRPFSTDKSDCIRIGLTHVLHIHVSHISYTYMSYTCLTHVLRMSYTCHTHVLHMSYTCLGHVIHASCTYMCYTCLTHVVGMLYTCPTHTCLAHFLHMS